MKNILLSYFESVLTLEAFFIEINLKLNENDQEKLKRILKNLSPIILAFDFDFKGPFKSIIDKRYTYEQLLLLCYIKINESKLPIHQNHMLKAGLFSNSSSIINNKNLNLNINLAQNELEKKLFSTDNLTLCYFLNKNQSNDGIHWRQLYDIIGFSIMKYIILYSYLFRKLTNSNSSNNYVQICGTRFSFIYRSLVSKKLEINEKKLEEKVCLKNAKKPAISAKIEPEEVIKKELDENLNKKKSKNLKDFFEEKDDLFSQNLINQKSILFQLKKLGNQNINKTSMLYDRNLGNKISNKYLYSDKNLEINSTLSRNIINNFIFKNLSFEEFQNLEKVEEMIKNLENVLINFVTKHRTCPYKIFLDCYCKSEENSTQTEQTRKRKRNQTESKTKEINYLSKNVSPKNVYCFLRRCLIHTLEYNDKTKQKFDTTCQLVGGKDNFDCLIKKLRTIVSGLKYDSFKISSLLHGLKISRISFLKPIECDRSKHLILLCVLRWLIEDYLFMIVKSNFYVTDTSKTNSEIFYYKKSDWKLILRNQLSDPVSKNYRKIYNLEKIKEPDLIGYCSRFESFGAHLGRLLPKNVNNECRIISGCKAFNPYQNKTIKINDRFVSLNNCIKWIIHKQPELIGFACRGQIELHRKYSKFLKLNYLNRFLSDDNSIFFKKWNFMKFDVNKCFDSIDSKELCSYLSQLIFKEIGYDQAFSLIKYAMFQIDIDNKQLKSKYDFITIKHALNEKGFLNGVADFINILENEQKANFTDFKLRNSSNGCGTIYVPVWIHDRNINFKKLNESIKKCLNHVIIKIHNDLYERVNGILQGSICSRNFCDLYLGRIEKKLFTYEENKSLSEIPMKLNRSNEIVMRIVDDYLVISSDYERLFKIKDLLKKELNLNESKTVVYKWKKPGSEFEMFRKSLILSKNFFNQIITENDENQDTKFLDFNLLSNFSNNFFSWCGLNIDVNTLDVYFNYEKYFDDSVSLNNRLNSNIDYKYAYIMFNIKFLRLFTSNVSILVMDTETNSFQAILRNFIDFFALSAIRFCLLSKLMPSQLIENVKLQIKIILNLCYWLNNKIVIRLKKLIENYFYSSFSLFKFLCLRTYLLIFLRFDLSKHACLIRLINIHLKKLNFIRCIKINCDCYFLQLTEIIEQQCIKFYNCKFSK